MSPSTRTVPRSYPFVGQLAAGVREAEFLERTVGPVAVTADDRAIDEVDTADERDENGECDPDEASIGRCRGHGITGPLT